MKQDPRSYAKALAAVAAGPLSDKQESDIIKNFARMLTSRVGRNQWPKFLVAAEKAMRDKEGVRKVTITSARPLSDLESEIKKILRNSDVVERKVDAELIAGMKVTIDETLQFDSSLRAKLNKLFTWHTT